MGKDGVQSLEFEVRSSKLGVWGKRFEERSSIFDPHYYANQEAVDLELIETMDLLCNRHARKALRAAKAGNLSYRDLDLRHESFGL